MSNEQGKVSLTLEDIAQMVKKNANTAPIIDKSGLTFNEHFLELFDCVKDAMSALNNGHHLNLNKFISDAGKASPAEFQLLCRNQLLPTYDSKIVDVVIKVFELCHFCDIDISTIMSLKVMHRAKTPHITEDEAKTYSSIINSVKGFTDKSNGRG